MLAYSNHLRQHTIILGVGTLLILALGKTVFSGLGFIFILPVGLIVVVTWLSLLVRTLQAALKPTRDKYVAWGTTVLALVPLLLWAVNDLTLN